MSMANTYPVPALRGKELPLDRQRRMVEELRQAWKAAPNDELRQWLGSLATTFGKVSFRRGRNLLRIGGRLVKGAWEEGKGALNAGTRGQLAGHLRNRGEAATATLKDLRAGAGKQLDVLRGAIRQDPAQVLPRVFVGALAFVAASGGPDGDGGVPDLDLQLGIDAHRNVFFHSFVAGAVIETLLHGIATGIGVLHRHLPNSHDPIWDAIAEHKDAYLTAAAQGAGAGIAYHLFVDATVQAAAYHDLPIEMPMEAHQVAIGASAAVEAVDVPRKAETFTGKKRTPSTPKRTEVRSGDRGGARPTVDEEEKARHLEFTRRRMHIDARIASALTDRERVIVEKFGTWLGAIEKGILRPITPDQYHFIKVCKGSAKPKSEMEFAWLHYRELMKARKQ